MPLLNYTSKVPVETSIAEIHAMLLRAKATDITTKYAQPSGKPVGIAFSIETPGGEQRFVLPARMGQVLSRLRAQGVTRKARYFSSGARRQEEGARVAAENGAMAERVAWRIVRDWLEAQVAMIEVGMMALDEVMLPHLLVDEHRTAYQVYQEQQAALPKAGR